MHEILPILKDVLEGKGAALSENQIRSVNEDFDDYAACGSKALQATIRKAKKYFKNREWLERLLSNREEKKIKKIRRLFL